MTRGEIWWADFGIPFGSEPDFRRPVLIVQADEFNKSLINTIVIVPFSTNLTLEGAPGNVLLERTITNLSKDSVVVVSQLYAVDRTRLIERISKLEKRLMYEIDDGMQLVLGISSRFC